jgi:predicted metal-dependent enzyme (double-stranded beta helix superfamily)
MNDMTFTGKQLLIDLIEEACAQDDHHATTEILRHGLSKLIADKSVFLPECVFEPVEGHYARRELYKCPKLGVTVVAMTWGPGQGTPIHDHCGLWCVEGVWQGKIEITSYEMQENLEDKCRFIKHETVLAEAGSSGSLIPPHEYHTICNQNPNQAAISLHIYQDSMGNCSIFEPIGDDWYAKGKKMLCLDPVDCE